MEAMEDPSPTVEAKKEAEKLKGEGNELVKAGDYENAAFKYQAAISVDPSVAAYYSNLSHCYFNLKQYEKMEAAARQCLECDDLFVKGYYRLAKALEQQERYEQALEVLDKALKDVIPDNTDLAFLRAQVQSQIEGNKCSLCGKPNAPLACSKCKTEYYCSEQCQALAWPSHKTLCSADSIVSHCNCSHCLKRMRFSDAKKCGRCKGETYCSRECQLADYPKHKPTCIRLSKQSEFVPGSYPTEIALFLKWYDSGIAYHVKMLGTHGMTKQQFLQQPPTFAVRMEFKFNPNYMGFLPVGLPQVVHINSLPAAAEIQRRMDMYQKPLQRHQLGHMMYVVLLPGDGHKGVVKFRHQIFQATDYQSESLQEAMNELRVDVGVCQHIAKEWRSLMAKTLYQQVHGFLDTNDDIWSSFVASAYHFHCKQSRLKNHVLIVYYEFGEHLGQIQRLTRFELFKMKKARKEMGEAFMDRALNATAKAGRVFLPTVFVSDDASHAFLDQGIYFPSHAVDVSLHEPRASDNHAAKCFEKLQRASFPPVNSSPNLEDYSIDGEA